MYSLQIDNVDMLQLPQELDLTNSSHTDAFALLQAFISYWPSSPSFNAQECL